MTRLWLMQKVSRRSQNCCVGMRNCVTEGKVNSGVGSADGRLDGIMAPAGTWWRTRFPREDVSGVS